LCIWAVKRGLLAQNPLQGLAKIDSRPQIPHRSLTDEEVVKLLNAAPEQRRLQYEAALATGFRVNELRSIRVKDLLVFGPALHLRADYSKDRKEHQQPITRELAQKLAEVAKDKPPEAPLLDIPTSKAWKLFKEDLKAAGIREETPEGKATWHSLRKVFINNVVKSGCDLKTIQTLARHSTAQLSMEVYAVQDPKRMRTAAEAAAGHIESILQRDSERKSGAEGVG
jgi:integrase